MSSPCHPLCCIEFSRWEKIGSIIVFILIRSSWCNWLIDVFLVRSNKYGNPPKRIDNRSFCLFSTPCFVLYWIFKVKHESDQPLYSSQCVLSHIHNSYPIVRDGNSPKLKHLLILSPSHAMICAVIIFQSDKKQDQPVCSSWRVEPITAIFIR